MTDTNHIEVLREMLKTGDVSDWRAFDAALEAAITALSARASAGEGGEDYRTHHDDFRAACLVAQTHATSDADRRYWQHQVNVLDRIKAAAPQPAQAGASGGGVAEIVRDLCELNPADPDAPETVCVRVADLERIVERHTTPASPATGRQADEQYRGEEWQCCGNEKSGSCCGKYERVWHEDDAATPQPAAAQGNGLREDGRPIQRPGTPMAKLLVVLDTIRSDKPVMPDRLETLHRILSEAADGFLATSQPATAQGGRAFQPGDRIEWQGSNGTWFPGKIVAVRDHVTTYDAKLDDGCDVKDFAAGRFRMLAAAPQPQEYPACAYRWTGKGWVDPDGNTPPAHGDGEGVTSEEMQALDRASAGCLRDPSDFPLLASLHEKLTTRPTPEAQEARDALEELRALMSEVASDREDALVSFFRTTGSAMGRYGDAMGWTPEQTARHFLAIGEKK